MKIILLAAAILWPLCTVVWSQPLQGREVSGAIYLENGSELVIPFIYHEKEQVIVHQAESCLQVYTTFHVDSFFFYDPELMWQRRFRKMTYRDRAHFFETVTPGKVSIIRRRLAQTAPESMVKNSADRHRLDYRYFVLHRGQIYCLRDFGYKNLRQIHPGLWREVKRFARKRNLNFYKMSDKVQMIRKLNALINEKDTFSLKE